MDKNTFQHSPDADVMLQQSVSQVFKASQGLYVLLHTLFFIYLYFINLNKINTIFMLHFCGTAKMGGVSELLHGIIYSYRSHLILFQASSYYTEMPKM